MSPLSTDRTQSSLRVWERGVGLTRACGTGACATAVAAIRSGACSRRSPSRLPGGDADHRWNEGGAIEMTGPANHVFTGSADWNAFRMSKLEVITMGCRLNLAESHALAEQLAIRMISSIVNSCAVTNEAVRQTRQAIRQARKRRPDARIIVTGCAAQVDPESFAAMPEVDAVLGNAEKATPLPFRHGRNSDVLVSDIMAVARNRTASRHRLCRQDPRLCRSAERLRPSLHLLHHPLWPGQQPLGACGQCGRAYQAAGRSAACKKWC